MSTNSSASLDCSASPSSSESDMAPASEPSSSSSPSSSLAPSPLPSSSSSDISAPAPSLPSSSLSSSDNWYSRITSPPSPPSPPSSESAAATLAAFAFFLLGPAFTASSSSLPSPPPRRRSAAAAAASSSESASSSSSDPPLRPLRLFPRPTLTSAAERMAARCAARAASCLLNCCSGARPAAPSVARNSFTRATSFGAKSTLSRCAPTQRAFLSTASTSWRVARRKRSTGLVLAKRRSCSSTGCDSSGNAMLVAHCDRWSASSSWTCA
mmetsp:Transcript_8537/g.25846  ORF Transcript_8537/g.25846 Transcript_8537/m.25846 type:complete len:269 (+) Transcript_8537:212-1018(+)